MSLLLPSSFPWMKLVLLVLLATGTHISMSPPQPPALNKNMTTRGTVFERMVRRMTWLVKIVTWIVAALDLIATLYAVYDPASLPSTLDAAPMEAVTLPALICPHPSSIVSMVPLNKTLTNTSSLFLLSVLSVTLGTLLRKYCYITLGRYFTFEVSIMPDHVLVTTGPYAWVRHPSYTGMYAVLIGVTGALGSKGVWVRECGVVPSLSTTYHGWSWTDSTEAPGDVATQTGTGMERAWALIAWLFVCVFIANIGYGLWSMAKRVGLEDAELRRRFGKEWELYARRVRWGMFPGIL